MKKLAIVAAAVFFLAGFSANGQMHQENSNKPGHQQGMMMNGNDMGQMGMMENMMCPMHQGTMGQQMPMKKYMMTVNMLPDMQSQLSLSQDQTEQLIDLQASFKKQQIDYKADLAKKMMNFQNLLENDASADEVRSQMQESANIHINMMVAAYETAHKMKSTLTNEQKDDLQKMMMQHGEMKQDGMQDRKGQSDQNNHNH